MPDMSPGVQVPCMDWAQAQYALIDGKKVRREAWSDPTVCIVIADGLLKIRQPSGKLDALLVSDADMQAEDWVVVTRKLDA